jgi:hypothetical protein
MGNHPLSGAGPLRRLESTQKETQTLLEQAEVLCRDWAA